MTEEEKKKVIETNATVALMAFHKLMERPERQNSCVFKLRWPKLRLWLWLVFVSLLPFGIVSAIALFADEPGVHRGYDPAIESAREGRLKAALEATTKQVDTTTNLKAVSEALSASEKIEEKVNGAAVKNQVGDHTDYTNQLLFMSAWLILAGLIGATLFAHVRLVSRHWNSLLVKPERGAGSTSSEFQELEDVQKSKHLDEKAKEIAEGWLSRDMWIRAGINIGVFLLLVFLVARLAPYGLPWIVTGSYPSGTGISSLFELSNWYSPDWETVVWMLAFTFTTVLLLTITHLTAFGTTIYAGNYPEVYRLNKIAEPLEELSKAKDGSAGSSLKPGTKGSEKGDPVEAAILVLDKHLDQTEKTKSVPVDHELRPDQILRVVKALVTPLAVLMVLYLVALSLAFDVAEARLDIPANLAVAVAKTNDAWVIALGAGFSLSLGFIYMRPFVRLSPYVSALEDAKKPDAENGWRLTGLISPEISWFWPMLGRSVDLMAEQPRAGTPVPFSEELEKYVGADRQKFQVIMKSANYGGGFHMLVEETLQMRLARLAPVLTSLAPALAGGLLKLLG